jgi:hypothetical protein
MSTKTDSSPVRVSGEDAVRRYLQFLEDPSSLVDAELVATLEAKLPEEEDVLSRLKILSAVEIASRVDAGQLLADFVASAGEFARRENIPASAFLRMGVPREALAAAGMLGSAAQRKRSPGAAGAVGSSPRRRVDRATVENAALTMADPFTIKDVESRTGANQLTVRKVLDALIASGALEDLAPDPDHLGPGRAPRRFRRTG